MLGEMSIGVSQYRYVVLHSQCSGSAARVVGDNASELSGNALVVKALPERVQQAAIAADEHSPAGGVRRR